MGWLLIFVHVFGIRVVPYVSDWVYAPMRNQVRAPHFASDGHKMVPNLAPGLPGRPCASQKHKKSGLHARSVQRGGATKGHSAFRTDCY